MIFSSSTYDYCNFNVQNDLHHVFTNTWTVSNSCKTSSMLIDVTAALVEKLVVHDEESYQRVASKPRSSGLWLYKLRHLYSHQFLLYLVFQINHGRFLPTKSEKCWMIIYATFWRMSNTCVALESHHELLLLHSGSTSARLSWLNDQNLDLGSNPNDLRPCSCRFSSSFSLGLGKGQWFTRTFCSRAPAETADCITMHISNRNNSVIKCSVNMSNTRSDIFFTRRLRVGLALRLLPSYIIYRKNRNSFLLLKEVSVLFLVFLSTDRSSRTVRIPRC